MTQIKRKSPPVSRPVGTLTLKLYIETNNFLFYHLTAQVTGDIRDVNPSPVALPNQLGKLNLSRLLHLHNKFEQTVMVGLVTSDDIRRTAEDMVTVLHATHQGVELPAAISGGHHYRLTPRVWGQGVGLPTRATDGMHTSVGGCRCPRVAPWRWHTILEL